MSHGLSHDTPRAVRPDYQDDARVVYSIDGMGWGSVELEPEVRDWLERLPTAQFATAAFYVDLLANKARC